MKQILKKIVVLFFISLTANGAFAQCWFDDLAIDMADANATSQFKNFINTDANAFEAYEIIHTAKGVTSPLKTNVNELKLVSDNLEDIVKFPGGYNAWKINNAGGRSKILAKLDELGDLPNAKSFINRLDDIELLSRIQNLTDIQLQKLDELYSSKHFKLPGERPIVDGQKVSGNFVVRTRNGKYDVYYNKKGFPNFTEERFGLGKDFALTVDNLAGNNSDFVTATRWLKDKFKNNKDIRIKSKSTNVEVTIDGKTNTYTWHHHEDGKTIMLVISDAHNFTAHTGGAAIIAKYLKGLFKSPY